MDNVYNNINDYNPKRYRQKLIFFDDLIADIFIADIFIADY